MNDNYTETFIHHAAICVQWQASDATDDGNGYPISESGDEFTDQVAELLTEDVTAFVADNWDDLLTAGVSAAQCGHDFVLTANGHGAGFWDRGLGAVGDRLTEATRGYSVEAEFALAGDRAVTGDYNSDDLVWLMVENTVIVNETREAFGDNWTGE